MSKYIETLKNAAKVKNDEFYTKIEDIDNELSLYTEELHNKIIYCNCDNPYKSNFVKYLINNFNRFNLKKLIATSYNKDGCGLKLEIDKKPIDKDYNSLIEELNNNGDFRSDECVSYLKQSDIVITNPPFSLFREYFAQLMKYKKKFIVIGNINAFTYKDFFPYFKAEQIRVGRAPYLHSMKFFINQNSETKCLGFTRWITNFDGKVPKKLSLSKQYYGNEDKYPKYDNYDAISIDKIADIPNDYNELMGVPVTFCDYFDKNRFQIIDKKNDLLLNGQNKFKRFIIKRKKK